MPDYVERHFPDSGMKDIQMLYCGYQLCKPHHSYGPSIRNHYLYHFIIEGKGTYVCNGRYFNLEAGQGFMAFPDSIIHYEADRLEPWRYLWVAFSGSAMRDILGLEVITPAMPVVRHSRPELVQAALWRILEIADDPDHARLMERYSLFYRFLSFLMDDMKFISRMENNDPDDIRLLLDKAVNYMKDNYQVDISSSKLASMLGFSRSYFQRVFKKHFGLSPINFLRCYRLGLAWHIILSTKRPIGQVATEVGYSDASYFCRYFKQSYGIRPGDLRKHYKLLQKEKGIQDTLLSKVPVNFEFMENKPMARHMLGERMD